MQMDELNKVIDESTWGDEGDFDAMEMKGRNSRRPKKANHGARPCSSYMRKLKKTGYYHKVKDEWLLASINI